MCGRLSTCPLHRQAELLIIHMADTLPCPNPTCTHVFTPVEIKGATALTCPLCRHTFQLRARAKPASAKPQPPAKPQAAAKPQTATKPQAPVKPPVAAPRPVEADAELDTELLDPPTPVAAPAVPGMPAADPFALDAHDAPLIRARAAPRRRWLAKLIVGLLVIMLCAGGVVAYLNFYPRGDGGTDEPVAPIETSRGKIRNARNLEEPVFKISLAKGVWTHDGELRNSLKAVLGLQRSNPEVRLAVAARDWGMQKPRDAELVQEAIDRLEGHFGDTLELAEKAVPTEFAGLPTQSLEFRGELHQVVWRGECLTFTDHGIGYWLFLAAPSLDVARQELADLKEKRGFSVVHEQRRGWTEQPPKMDTFSAGKLPATLRAPEGIWDKARVEDEDERGELLLLGRYQKEKDNRKNAIVLVLSLDKKADLKAAAKAARDYVETRKKEEAPEYQLAVAADGKRDDGPITDLGNRRGVLLDFRVSLQNDPKRYMLLAVIHDEKTIAIRCECAWENRHIWRQEFLDLLSSLRVRKDAD